MYERGIDAYKDGCDRLAEEFCEKYGLVKREINYDKAEMSIIVLSDRRFIVKISDMFYALTHDTAAIMVDEWIATNYRAWMDANCYVPLFYFLEKCKTKSFMA